MGHCVTIGLLPTPAYTVGSARTVAATKERLATELLSPLNLEMAVTADMLSLARTPLA